MLFRSVGDSFARCANGAFSHGGVDGLFVGILDLVETLAAGLGTKYITCSCTDYELKHYFALLPVLFTHMRSISCSILPGSSTR